MVDTDTRVRQLEAVQAECRELFRRKNTSYGDAFKESGPVGVLIRIGDKLRRYQKITRSGINLVESESLRDTLLDLHNYSAMCVLLLDEDEGDSE